ncbi:MAG: Oxygen regulatory protein NreC [Syntrophus sp. SKADARSKE-3]|nr:Oxygen regulatory protein NreC [Syntrophus sp. SKADARSKE-3]
MTLDGQSLNQKRRIMIVEDHPIFRLGLRELINQEKDLVVCGEAEDKVGAWMDIQRLKPDFVILDLSLKDGDGISLIKNIVKTYKNMPVLVVSMHDESIFAERSLIAGAKGYINKRETSVSIIEAIHCILRGKVFVSDNIKEEILEHLVGGLDSYDRFPIDRLTDRELEVFHMIGKGLSSNEIAGKLNLSIKTIGTYRERIKEKLHLKNACELIRHAMLWAENEQIEALHEYQ